MRDLTHNVALVRPVMTHGRANRGGPNQVLPRRLLAEAERRDLVHNVRELIGELLHDSTATLEHVAARLNMPTRRLREHLSVSGVRFNDLLTDYRCCLAKDLLLNTDERIELIVQRTGFSEPSTFYRAFKRWVGETPVAFRQRGKAATVIGRNR